MLHFFTSNLNAIKASGIPQKGPTAEARGRATVSGTLTTAGNVYGQMYGVVNAGANTKLKNHMAIGFADGQATVSGTLTSA